jgi:hypothetical protein
MSSINAPFGFRPVGHFTGGIIRPDQSNLTIAYTYATQIFFGDLVTIASATGQIQQVASGAGNAAIGVFAGVEYTGLDGRR